MPRPIIFDFDGVIADSEVLSAFRDCLTAFGFPTSEEEESQHYRGLRLKDCVAVAERLHKRKLPGDFVDVYRARSFERLRRELKPVSGAVEFIRALGDRPIAIASSSGPARLELCLTLLGLTEPFAGRVCSAADLARGKPFPDVYLHAAKTLPADPRTCIVIEDGTHGVQAAVAAGMTPIGLTAGSHCGPDHGSRLRAAGASLIAENYQDVASIVRTLDAQKT
ncbi:MAG: HAD family phosphatase [Alphaproteobacteria bacterium]|nr:HAD family phosphatase [Alphaproteobacteria bacterium]